MTTGSRRLVANGSVGIGRRVERRSTLTWRDRVVALRMARRRRVMPTGCWMWTGAKTPAGYGNMAVPGSGGKTTMVHRLSYQLLVGPITPGREIDHLCRHKWCFNPDHLELVTHADNLSRGVWPHVSGRDAWLFGEGSTTSDEECAKIASLSEPSTLWAVSSRREVGRG